MALRTSDVLLPHISELFGMEVKAEGVRVDLLNGFPVSEMKREGSKKVVLTLTPALILSKKPQKLYMIHLPPTLPPNF